MRNCERRKCGCEPGERPAAPTSLVGPLLAVWEALVVAAAIGKLTAKSA